MGSGWLHDDRESSVTSTPAQSTTECDQNGSPSSEDRAAVVHRRGRGHFTTFNNTPTLYCETIPAAPHLPETPRRHVDPAGAAARMARGAFASLGRPHGTARKGSHKEKEAAAPKRDETPSKSEKRRRNRSKKGGVAPPEEEKEADKPNNRHADAKKTILKLRTVEQKEVKPDEPTRRFPKVNKTINHQPAAKQKEPTAVHAKHPYVKKTVNLPVVEQKKATAVYEKAELLVVRRTISNQHAVGDKVTETINAKRPEQKKMEKVAMTAGPPAAVDYKKHIDVKKSETLLALKTITNLPTVEKKDVKEADTKPAVEASEPKMATGARSNWGAGIMARMSQRSQ